VGFVVGLEAHCHIEHRLLQQAAAGAQLVGIDGFVLQTQRHVQDAHVFGGIACHALGHGVFAGQKGDGHSGQGACATHEGAARRSRRSNCLNDGLHCGIL